MTFLSSIGAGIFSDISVYNGTTTDYSTIDTQVEFDALFGTESATPGAATFQRIKNVREFPPMGTPANVVNVPVYGQKTSQQVQGQADAPSFELQMNYVASDWVSTAGKVGAMVGDGEQHVFRFLLANSQPTGTGATQYASSAAGIGTVENAYFYFLGKIEAQLITPALTDANQSTLTITIQSQFYGAYTV